MSVLLYVGRLGRFCRQLPAGGQAASDFFGVLSPSKPQSFTVPSSYRQRCDGVRPCPHLIGRSWFDVLLPFTAYILKSVYCPLSLVGEIKPRALIFLSHVQGLR